MFGKRRKTIVGRQANRVQVDFYLNTNRISLEQGISQPRGSTFIKFWSPNSEARQNASALSFNYLELGKRFGLWVKLFEMSRHLPLGVECLKTAWLLGLHESMIVTETRSKSLSRR